MMTVWWKLIVEVGGERRKWLSKCKMQVRIELPFAVELSRRVTEDETAAEIAVLDRAALPWAKLIKIPSVRL